MRARIHVYVCIYIYIYNCKPYTHADELVEGDGDFADDPQRAVRREDNKIRCRRRRSVYY